MAVGYTSDDLAALKAALVTGATKVQIGDREISYRTKSELLDLIRIVQAELSAPSTSSSPNLIKATFSKGAK